MYESRTQTAFFFWLVVYFQCFSPAAALTNKIGLKHLANVDAEYPLVRIFSTVGWISAGLFLGFAWPWATGQSIDATRTPLMLGACGSVLMAFYSLTLPHTPPEGAAETFCSAHFGIAASCCETGLLSCSCSCRCWPVFPAWPTTTTATSS